MKKFLMMMPVLMLLAVGCQKDNSSNYVSPTDADKANLSAIEQEAIQHGVSIRYGDAQYSQDHSAYYTELKISWGGVGNTDEELQAAIQILRKYHAAITTATSSITEKYDREQRLDSVNEAMTRIQGIRNDILTKKICSTNGSNTQN